MENKKKYTLMLLVVVLFVITLLMFKGKFCSKSTCEETKIDSLLTNVDTLKSDTTKIIVKVDSTLKDTLKK